MRGYKTPCYAVQVNPFTREEKVIAKFESITDCAAALGKDPQYMHKAVKNRYMTCGVYVLPGRPGGAERAVNEA